MTNILNIRGLIKMVLISVSVLTVVIGFNVSLVSAGTTAFTTTWTIDSGTSITIPTHSGETYNYDVYWENVATSSHNGSLSGETDDATVVFGQAGTYEVEITGTFPRIYFNNAGDKDKIMSIEQWGDNGWTSMGSAFYGASNLEYNASDVPDLSGVTDMSQMFYGASSFNGDLSGWDVSTVTDMNEMFRMLYGTSPVFSGDGLSGWNVSSVTDMSYMFYGAGSFNGDLSGWIVSSVTDMSYMFYWANSFNGDLSNWDVSGVESMRDMFYDTPIFNSDLSNWNVSSVTTMSGMFQRATSFNQDLSNWNVSSVTDMGGMFARASSFSGDLSNWNVSSVTDMSYMFYEAGSFNGDLSNWNVSSVTNMGYMFLDAVSFNGDLNNWNVSSVTDMEYMFSDADSFNRDLSNWNVSSVTNMEEMFFGTDSFNRDLSSWNVSSVTNMGYMFEDTGSFNGDISNWNVSSVTEMTYMFDNATSFNQDLSDWDISSLNSGYDHGLYEAFIGSNLSNENYTDMLIGWEGLSNTPSGIYLNADAKYYSHASDARASLEDTYGWVISDGDVIEDSSSSSSSGGGGGGPIYSENVSYYRASFYNDDTATTDAEDVESVAEQTEEQELEEELGAETFRFLVNLSSGMSNNDVRELQNRLTAEGSYSGPVTGYFGPLTLEATIAYQETHGISPAVGYVGPLTRAELNSSNAPTGELTQEEQEAIQEQINALLAIVESLLEQLADLDSM